MTAKKGAPTKYTEEHCQHIIQFFKDSNGLPFFSAYAREIDVDADTLHEWKKVHPDFSEAYKECKAIQKEHLVNKALQGEYNPSFSIFTAKNIIGWRDQKDIKLSGGIKLDGLTTDEIDKELDDLERWTDKKPKSKKVVTTKGKDKA